MTNEIHLFNFQNNWVRIAKINGEPWFIAKDICDYFGDTNRNRTMSVLSENQKGYTQMTTPGGMQSMAIVSEAGLYAMLFAMQPEKGRGITEEYIAERQNKINAFKDWVFEQVLPTIRKHGAYMTPETIQRTLSDPDFLISLATRLKEEQRKAAFLEATVRESEPKVLFADAVSVSQSEILIGDLAKILKQNGIDIGQKRLFERLRNEGFLMKSGMSWNLPTQRAMDLGLFRVQEKAISKPDGSVLLSRTTRVTGKVQLYFTNYFLHPEKRIKAPCVAF